MRSRRGWSMTELRRGTRSPPSDVGRSAAQRLSVITEQAEGLVVAVADQAPHAGPAADLRIVPMRGAEPVIVVNHEPCRERLATDSAPTLLLRVKPRDLDPRQTLRVRVGIRRSSRRAAAAVAGGRRVPTGHSFERRVRIRAKLPLKKRAWSKSEAETSRSPPLPAQGGAPTAEPRIEWPRRRERDRGGEGGSGRTHRRYPKALRASARRRSASSSSNRRCAVVCTRLVTASRYRSTGTSTWYSRH